MDICHITLTAERDNRLPLFPDEESFREGLRRIGCVFNDRLALHCLLPEHVHLLPVVGRGEAGRLAQATLHTLGPMVRTPLAESHIRSVESRAHLRWLVRYFLEQPERHGLPVHPALFVGSCYPDLCGARLVPGLSLCIATVMPTFHIDQASRIVGLAQTPGLADRESVRAAGAMRLKRAAAAALAVPPTLAGNRAAVVRARSLVVHIARRVGLGDREVTWALGVTDRTVRNLARREARSEEIGAVRRQLALEDVVRRPDNRPFGK